jgi:DNA-binding NtrC family response regulator
MRRETDPQLIGDSSVIRELREEVRRVAASEAKVLITGESGAGKELVAKAIHTGSRRSQQAFVAMNCAGLPETLLESELFGHARGSFTGAYRDKPGKLELADRGTVFLDEVGEMTLRMQALLLRFLETGELQKVGSDGPGRVVSVRVIAATNRDLRSMIDGGSFREDLFYRLNVIHLQVPSLRERKDDIPALLEHFLARYRFRQVTGRQFASTGTDGSAASGQATRTAAPEMATPARFAPDALRAMVEYPWPGNVRELENAIERIVVRARGEEIGLEDLPPEMAAPSGFTIRPKRERRRTVVDDLYKRMRQDAESFWTAVYPLYMQREITRDNVRDVVRKGLEEARGNYRIVAALFNLPSNDYKKFLNFLRKHQCQLPFKEYRR